MTLGSRKDLDFLAARQKYNVDSIEVFSHVVLCSMFKSNNACGILTLVAW